MATRTASAPGDSSNTVTWGGDPAPVSGDLAVINVAVTVDANAVWGTAPTTGSGTFAIDFGASGALTIAAGVTLTIRGDWRSANGFCPVTMEAGAILEFDVPSGESYTANHYGSWTINGTSGAHCAIRSKAGGGTASFTFASFLPWTWAVNYCDLSRLGDENAVCFNMLTVTQPNDVVFLNCTFDECGRFYHDNAHADEIFRFEGCTFTNSMHSTLAAVFVGGAALGSGTYSIQDNTFDKEVTLSNLDDYTVDDNEFAGGYTIVGTFSFASFSGNTTGGGGEDPPPDVPGYDLWLSRLASEPPNFNASFDPADPYAWFNAHHTDHDVLFVAIKAEQLHPGNADLIACRDHCRAAFRDTYLPDPTVNYGPGEAYIFFLGLGADWEYNGDTASRAAMLAMRETVLFTGDGLSPTERESRGDIYILTGFVELDRLSLRSWDDRQARVDQLVGWALGHIDIWLGDPQTWIDDWATVRPGQVSYIQAFMMGLTGHGLCYYDDRLLAKTGARDPRILLAVTRLAVRLREMHWRPPDGYTNRGDFIYQVKSDGTFYPAADDPDTAEFNSDSLNNLVAAFFAWIYARTGDTYFRTAAEEAFDGASDTPNLFGGKQYGELNRFAFDLLRWLAGGVDSVPTTGFYSAVGPFWPRVQVGVASEPIHVKPIAAMTGTITPTVAGGTCTPASLTWAGTSEPKTFTVTFASAVGQTEIALSNDAGLTNPPSLAFTVSGAVAPVTRVLFLSRPGGRVLTLDRTP